MTIPREFTRASVEENSPAEEQLYTAFLSCGEPWKSMYANNPWLAPPDLRKPLEWGTGRYWDTTVARKHPYWKDKDLPQPTRPAPAARGPEGMGILPRGGRAFGAAMRALLSASS